MLDGTHYLVMEYVDGCSLSELLQAFDRQNRTLEPELAAAIVAQVAGGLHAAHETRDQDGQPLEIIHRHVSQSNILLSVAGNAKVIFGIAKARNRMSETVMPMLKGKFKYVAPEQASRSSPGRSASRRRRARTRPRHRRVSPTIAPGTARRRCRRRRPRRRPPRGRARRPATASDRLRRR